MTLAELKIELLKEIMSIESEDIMKKIYRTVQNYTAQSQNKTSKEEKISFEEWNKQFIDNADLDEYIEEYGMTLREYRQAIYDAEMDDEELTEEEFKESLKSWLE